MLSKFLILLILALFLINSIVADFHCFLGDFVCEHVKCQRCKIGTCIFGECLNILLKHQNGRMFFVLTSVASWALAPTSSRRRSSGPLCMKEIQFFQWTILFLFITGIIIVCNAGFPFITKSEAADYTKPKDRTIEKY
ncbi:Protein CBG01130 [Caenorhabditis briggsae]|uniref:Protein CBG01130 n=1 Tax=Caenorhabditis briggsae TaxID=6238 RepID=A8WPM5_CAEBR|nr:Protein CBG01130 [Caenorhabditis briggsae]CAP22432.1 Protein CBG01130 [Caenorhabditis briggsae]